MATIRFDDRVGHRHGCRQRARALPRARLSPRAARRSWSTIRGGALDGTGASTDSAAAQVVAEIAARGRRVGDRGQCRCHRSRRRSTAMIERIVCALGPDPGILVNNAGILRDKSFAKMTLEDFRAVFEVHVMGRRARRQGGVGANARAELRPHRLYHLVVRPLRQFRPGELRHRQIGADRVDEGAGPGRAQTRASRAQHPLADGGDAHDRESDAGGRSRVARSGERHAGASSISSARVHPRA